MNRIGVLALLSAATMFPLASSLAAEQQLNAEVPFAFTVANRTLPAGEYRIEHHGVFLSLQNRDDNQMVTLVANPGERSKDGKSFLSFDKVNGVLFLRRVATPDARQSVELVASRALKQALKAEHERVFMGDSQR